MIENALVIVKCYRAKSLIFDRGGYLFRRIVEGSGKPELVKIGATDSDELPLLTAIYTNSNDDMPVLAFADWCTENGFAVAGEDIRHRLALARAEERYRESRSKRKKGIRQLLFEELEMLQEMHVRSPQQEARRLELQDMYCRDCLCQFPQPGHVCYEAYELRALTEDEQENRLAENMEKKKRKLFS